VRQISAHLAALEVTRHVKLCPATPQGRSHLLAGMAYALFYALDL